MDMLVAYPLEGNPMKKDHDNTRQEDWDEQDDREQELYRDPTTENAERYREANDKVRNHYPDTDD